MEIRVSKLEGKEQDIVNKISKKQFSELGSKVASTNKKLQRYQIFLRQKEPKEGTISSLAPETGKTL